MGFFIATLYGRDFLFSFFCYPAGKDQRGAFYSLFDERGISLALLSGFASCLSRQPY
jgi:hypothetical protein